MAKKRKKPKRGARKKPKKPRAKKKKTAKRKPKKTARKKTVSVKAQRKRTVKYKRFVNVFKESPIVAMNYEIVALAVVLKEYITQVIYSQQYNWKKLSPKYLEWKRKKGLDQRTLIATGDYVAQIQVRKIGRGTGQQTVVGVPTARGKNVHYSGYTYTKLANLHEFGSKDHVLPARPHWRPAKSWLVRNLPKIRRRMAKRVAREIRSKMGGG